MTKQAVDKHIFDDDDGPYWWLELHGDRDNGNPAVTAVMGTDFMVTVRGWGVPIPALGTKFTVICGNGNTCCGSTSTDCFILNFQGIQGHTVVIATFLHWKKGVDNCQDLQ